MKKNIKFPEPSLFIIILCLLLWSKLLINVASFLLLLIFFFLPISFPLSLYHSYCPYVIPVKTGIHPSVFLFIFLPPSVIASTALGAWQSRTMSLRTQIYQGATISFSYIVQYSPFLHYKNYKKTIFFINIYYIYYITIIHTKRCNLYK